MVHLTSCCRFGQMLCNRQVPQNGPPHILLPVWSKALLPPGTTKWSTSHLVVNFVKCFATARYHKMVHLTCCFQFGQMLCCRQVPQSGLPRILLSVWSNALLPPGTTQWSTSHVVFNLVKCFATARYHKMIHLTSCFQFGQMLCYRQVPHNGPPHILLSVWSNSLLPPSTTQWSTSHVVFSLVKCFATAKYHTMVHLASCCQFGQTLCYRQVPQNGPPHILFSIWSNALLPPGTTKWSTSHLVVSLVTCFATARYHRMVHLTSCCQFGHMLCYRHVPQDDPPHILFSNWSNALLPPGTTKWSTSHLVAILVKCFATARYHTMVHITCCFQSGQMLCYRQVPQNGLPHILLPDWSNALLPPGTTQWSTSQGCRNATTREESTRPTRGPMEPTEIKGVREVMCSAYVMMSAGRPPADSVKRARNL